MALSQQQLFKVAELTFSQLADIPSFIPHQYILFPIYIVMLSVVEPESVVALVQKLISGTSSSRSNAPT
jgi:hypothetical protein